MHRLIAERLPEDPGVVESARQRVRRWQDDGAIDPRWAREWLELLDGPLDELSSVLVDAGERARHLRQTSPFAGALDARARWAAWRAVGERFAGSR